MTRSRLRLPLLGLAMLAIVATILTVGSSSTNPASAQSASSCVSASLLTNVQHYYDINKDRAPGYGENWKSVLVAFGDVEDSNLTAMTAADARVRETRWSGWKPVREALECIEEAAERQTQSPPATTPEISIASDGNVTEGSYANFTVTATPAPAAALTVSVTVTQRGDFASTGSKTVTISTSGSATLAVPTRNDSIDEPDGLVTATLASGSGYTVSSSAGSATVAVSDDDVPLLSIFSKGDVTEGADASFTVLASPTPHSSMIVSVAVSATGDFGVTTGLQTVTIPSSGFKSFTVSTTGDSTDEPDGSITATLVSGSGYTVSSSLGAATVAVSDDDGPELSIVSNGEVTEGADASFIVIASPKPHSALVVSVTVSATGAFGVTTGSQSVTIPTSGWKSFSISTTDDEIDEIDGSVTATLATGRGYTVSSSSGSATVTVSDDDGGISTNCTLPADAVTVAEITGWRDALDPNGAAAGIKRWNRALEALGQDTGTGVTPMTPEQAQDVADWLGNTRWDRTARTISAAYCDGGQDRTTESEDTKPAPNAVPELSVVGNSAITEGGDATFTVTANPAPTGTIAVPVIARVTQEGRYTSSDGQIVGSIGPSGSITFTVSTRDDDRDEPDGHLTFALNADTLDPQRFTVSATHGVATVVVSDDDAPGSGTTVTYTEFWAPFQDLIAKVEAVRNHELFGQFSSHTDLYDTVLLALGRDVAKQSLEPMPAYSARILAASSSTDIWDEIAPALDAIFHNGPPPAPMPTLDNPLPASLNLSESVGPTVLMLADHFGHETDADLTFTVMLDNPIATISQWDEHISIKNTSIGTATLTVTASDGTNSISTTVGLEAPCSPTSRLSSDGTFCVSALTAIAYNGTVTNHPSSPNGPGDDFIADVRLEEGTTGEILVRVWVNKPQAGNACRMRGYITIEPQTVGQTIPTGVTATTYGNTTSPKSSAGQGWNDVSCSNSYLTTNARNYRLARIRYDLSDDEMPGTTLNGAKLVYHDMDISGSSVVGTYDLVKIHFRDSIATVAARVLLSGTDPNFDADGNASTTLIYEDSSSYRTVHLSGEHLVGYLAPRMEDIRKGGKFTEARMTLEHGHAVYWQPSVCAFNLPANTGANRDNRTATCDITWDWKSDGSNGSDGMVKLVWHETDGAGWDRPDVQTTEVATLTMADTGGLSSRSPGGWITSTINASGDIWVEAAGGQNTASSLGNLANVTTIEEGDRFNLKVVAGTAGGNQLVALEVRTATNSHGTTWSAWQNLDQEVGHLSLAIQEESVWNLYTQNSSFAECFMPGGFNCFGGSGAWSSGPNNTEVINLQFVSHDDNFVSHPERYYQFRVKDSTSTKPYPILRVTEDDAIVFSLHPQQETGKLRVNLAKKVNTRVQFTLWTDRMQSSWYNRTVTYEAGERGSMIIDRGCDGRTDDIRVWASINAGQHHGVMEYVSYFDGRVDPGDDRKGQYVIVRCGN